MTIRNLHFATDPTSIAVVGASSKQGSVGEIVLRNIIAGGFKGAIWPVNPKYDEAQGLRCYRRIADLPGVADLAVIMTPPKTVPDVIAALGAKGTRAAIVLTAGITKENGLRQAMLNAARPHLLRVIGPNTLGLMIPSLGLNASFAHMAAQTGDLALLSQSGAIATTLIDWAADKGIGFSHVVSMGDMADVDVGDYLDMLAGDSKTKAILLYLESIPNPRKFLSAARAASRMKPVIAIKSGRHEQAAKAATTHTGALSGADRVVDAALKRAGILRVNGLSELFDAAETLSRFKPMQRSRVAIITNGGGAGVLAVDQLVDGDSKLAALSAETIARLNATLPATWSHANPVDIIGDAPPERYASAIKAVSADDGVDALMVLNCPTGLASPASAAQAVAALTDEGTINGKPVFACWLGEHSAKEGRKILQSAGVASYETPESAAAAVSYVSDWSRSQSGLVRTPSGSEIVVNGGQENVARIFKAAASESRRMLTEPEAKQVLSIYGIPVTETVIAKSIPEVIAAATKLLASSSRVVVKILSKTLSHKSDVGGVVLDLESASAAGAAAKLIVERLEKFDPRATIEGFAVQPMIERTRAQELILGVSKDPIFGPILMFGAGGVSVEVVNDTAVTLPPIDDVLAGNLIDQTRVGRLLAGYRDREPANRPEIVRALMALSQLTVDFPCIVSIDVNPLLADSKGVVVLDARIEIEPDKVAHIGPNSELVIRPYPEGWVRDITLKGKLFKLRPIRPSDAALYPDFLAQTSAEDMRMRFFGARRSLSRDTLVRLTQLDYDRDMAFVALDAADGKLVGISRMSADPDHEHAEFALLVRSDMQGHGIGTSLMRILIEYASRDGIHKLKGLVMHENTKMLALCKNLGFAYEKHPQEPGVLLVVMTIEESTKPQL